MTPEIRKLYGVYATPGPLVGFMVRSERAPDGTTDENIFRGVAQGAAVLFLVKRLATSVSGKEPRPQ